MSLPASPQTVITPAILDTILGQLATHFLAGANHDLPTARHAASHMLAAYGAETEEELRLAVEIVSFGFRALEALGGAASVDLPASAKHRLRVTAVNLSRASRKSQRKLDQLRRARLAVSKRQDPPSHGRPDPAVQPIAFAKDALGTQAPTGRQRGAAERIAEKRPRNQAEQARQAALAAAWNSNQSGAA
ncbi:MAG TPA: hypothetical protein VGM42_19055 [Rhodopila sp.]|jgi:hypothetical protein